MAHRQKNTSARNTEIPVFPYFRNPAFGNHSQRFRKSIRQTKPAKTTPRQSNKNTPLFAQNTPDMNSTSQSTKIAPRPIFDRLAAIAESWAAAFLKSDRPLAQVAGALRASRSFRAYPSTISRRYSAERSRSG